jgi:serine/threonine protein phosphatase PrpC
MPLLLSSFWNLRVFNSLPSHPIIIANNKTQQSVMNKTNNIIRNQNYFVINNRTSSLFTIQTTLYHTKSKVERIKLHNTLGEVHYTYKSVDYGDRCVLNEFKYPDTQVLMGGRVIRVYKTGKTTTTIKNKKDQIDLAIELRGAKSSDENVTVNVTVSDSPISDNFTVRLCRGKDAKHFVADHGWTLKTSKSITTLYCEYLGKPCAPPVKTNAYGLVTGPSGFLPYYGGEVLMSAIAYAFDGPLNDNDPPPLVVHSSHYYTSKVPLPPICHVELSGLIRPTESRPSEDGYVMFNDVTRGMCMLAAFDGHGGVETMKYCETMAKDIFVQAFDHFSGATGRVNGMTRTGAIRFALRYMYNEIDQKCIVKGNELVTYLNADDKILELRKRRRVEINDSNNTYWYTHSPSLIEQQPIKPPNIRESGACACVCIVDLNQSLLHVSSVGDCWAGIVQKVDDTTSVKVVSPMHESHDPREQARIMLRGSYVDRRMYDDGPFRMVGRMEPTRALGDEVLKRTSPEIERAFIAEPSIELIRLVPGVDQQILVASDGVGPFTFVKGKDDGYYKEFYNFNNKEVKEPIGAEEWMEKLRHFCADDRVIVAGVLSW